MIILVIAALGLILGSFVNALVWRVYMQEKESSKAKKDAVLPPADDLSILKGRSMCPQCKHPLAAKDLIPVISWLILRGKCRYCHKPISRQYPLVELATAGLFILSALLWPRPDNDAINYNFVINLVVWLSVMIPGFMALIVYDLRWMLLPNRIIYPMIVIASILASFNIISADNVISALINTGTAVAIAGGIFYLLFVVSNGRWIGGGDVKLGLLIGLLLAKPELAFLILLLASVLGTLFVVPGLLLKKVTTKSRIPFGPFLIIAAIIVKLFGATMFKWYENFLLGPV
ncbi:MAG: prepilin peptidase [bacterium]|nr:prepilin peptidase [bacterium]